MKNGARPEEKSGWEIAMTFAENIKLICAERGTNLTAVVKAVKGSSSFATTINRGFLPKENELLEMAKLLGCQGLL